MDEERIVEAEETADNSPTPTNLHAVEFAPENAAIKPRRTRQTKPVKKMVPNRAPEDCYETDPRKMTDAERIAVIKFYQDNLKGVYDQFETYKKNTEGAFEQARRLRDENERIKLEATVKINLIKQNVNLLYQNTLLIKLED